MVELLMQWLAQAWCWLLEHLLLLGVAIIQMVTVLMPSVSVPSALVYNSTLNNSLSFLAWICPVGIVSWCLLGWIAVEMFMAVGLPLYRLFADLL